MIKRSYGEAKRPNDVDTYVGTRVRMRRKMLGMSQEKLGSELGITFQQVQKYEKGTNRIGAGRLQDISEILGVPVSFFFPPTERSNDQFDAGQHDQRALMEFLATSEGVELNNAVSQIKDDNVRRRVVALVRSIAENESGSLS